MGDDLAGEAIWTRQGVYSARLRDDHAGMIVGFNAYVNGKLFYKYGREQRFKNKLDLCAARWLDEKYRKLHAALTEGERAMDRGRYDLIPPSKNQQTRPIDVVPKANPEKKSRLIHRPDRLN
jgi:hypothetical protein